MVNTTIIKSDIDKCVGCNKCIRVCPHRTVNKVVSTDKGFRITINQEDCVGCGECIKACAHGARGYEDDTGRFLTDLKNGKSLAVIVAPAFLLNYPNEYKNAGARVVKKKRRKVSV